MRTSKKTEKGAVPAAPIAPAAWELAVIDVFVRGAAMFGLRKSVGMVFGALYCSRAPLSAQELQAKLQLSRGAVVEALQLLRRLGAARVHLKIGDRRDYFAAETDLKNFVRGFLKEVLEPALEKAELRLVQAKTAASADAGGNASGASDADFASSRVASLSAWKSRFGELIPLLDGFLSRKEK